MYVLVLSLVTRPPKFYARIKEVKRIKPLIKPTYDAYVQNFVRFIRRKHASRSSFNNPRSNEAAATTHRSSKDRNTRILSPALSVSTPLLNVHQPLIAEAHPSTDRREEHLSHQEQRSTCAGTRFAFKCNVCRRQQWNDQIYPTKICTR